MRASSSPGLDSKPELALAGVIAGGAALLALAFFPGYHSPDTDYILAQARGAEPVTNWHPLGYTALQTGLLALFGSPAWLWTFQIGVWLGAVWAFGQRLAAGRAFAAALLLFCPALFFNMAALWKDDLAAAFTLATLAAALATRPRRAIAAAVAFGTAAALVRTDYLVIVLPFVMLATYRALPSRARRTPTVLAGGVGLLAAATWATKSLNPLDAEIELTPWATVAVWDIGGIALRDEEAETVIGDLIVPDDAFAASYDCRSSDGIAFVHEVIPFALPRQADRTPPGREAAALATAWRVAVMAEPRAYAAHRTCVMASYLGISGVVQHPVPGRSPGSGPYGPAQPVAALAASILSQGPFFRLWLYLVGGTVTACFVSPQRRPVALAILASMAAATARGLILPAADLRYGLWIVVGAMCIAGLALEGRALRRERRSDVS